MGSFGAIKGSPPLFLKMKTAVDGMIGAGEFAGKGKGKGKGKAKGKGSSKGSVALRNVVDSLKKPSTPIVQGLSLMWLDAMLTWMEWKEGTGKKSENLTLRMDEF